MLYSTANNLKLSALSVVFFFVVFFLKKINCSFPYICFIFSWHFITNCSKFYFNLTIDISGTTGNLTTERSNPPQGFSPMVKFLLNDSTLWVGNTALFCSQIKSTMFTCQCGNKTMAKYCQCGNETMATYCQCGNKTMAKYCQCGNETMATYWPRWEQNHGNVLAWVCGQGYNWPFHYHKMYHYTHLSQIQLQDTFIGYNKHIWVV
jgi:hypothetical protein